MIASVLVALIGVALVVGVLVLARVATNVGGSWLRPAHAPLWVVAGTLTTATILTLTAIVPESWTMVANRFHLAPQGPSARMAQLALALATLLAAFAITRLAFAAVRRRRLDRAPLPTWFLLAGIAPDGRPLRALRKRLFVATLAITLGLVAASVLIPYEAPSILWTALTTLTLATALAVAPTKRAPARTRAPAYAPTPAPAPVPHLHQSHLDEARAQLLQGNDVLWLTPTADAATHAREAFAAFPEAVFLPALPTLALADLATYQTRRLDLIVIEDADQMTGLELAYLDHHLARFPHATVIRLTGAAASARPRPLRIRNPIPALPTRAPRLGTPIRTTRIRLIGIPQSTRHRFRGPLELELVAARAELHVTDEGTREHGPDQRRTHTRSTGSHALPPIVVDARVAVVPTADVTTLHTLAHVLRDLAPEFYRGANDIIGVTYATPSELARPHGALVVHDRDADLPGSVADLTEADWLAWLTAARARLAACDCHAHCARCCESVSCTATPHNVGLDRRRALALLDGLLVPSDARRVA